MHQDIKEILFTAEQIQARVDQLGAEISRDYANREILSVSYTHLTLPTTIIRCRSRWSPYH